MTYSNGSRDAHDVGYMTACPPRASFSCLPWPSSLGGQGDQPLSAARQFKAHSDGMKVIQAHQPLATPVGPTAVRRLGQRHLYSSPTDRPGRMRGADSDPGRSDRPTLSDPSLGRFRGSEVRRRSQSLGDLRVSDPVSDPDRPFRPSRNGPTDRPSLGDPEDDESKINFALPRVFPLRSMSLSD